MKIKFRILLSAITFIAALALLFAALALPSRLAAQDEQIADLPGFIFGHCLIANGRTTGSCIKPTTPCTPCTFTRSCAVGVRARNPGIAACGLNCAARYAVDLASFCQ